MKRANKITVAAVLAAFAAFGSAEAAFSQETQRTLVWPGPPTVPHQPRLGFYGHLEPGWGMVVDHVLWGTPAFRAGLERGDVLVRINHRRILSYRDHYWALRTSGSVCWLLVDDVRGRGRVWIPCRLRRPRGPVLLGGREAPDPGTASPEQKPPTTFTPPIPEAKRSGPARRSPEASDSDKADGSRGPIL
ncbi:MAG: hypothetical protein ACYTG0_05470 [Planctomycetota bacterium]|jgi:hypothetical protein